MMGLEDEQATIALAIMRSTCHTRTRYVDGPPAVEASGVALALPVPVEVQVSGATNHTPDELRGAEAGDRQISHRSRRQLSLPRPSRNSRQPPGQPHLLLQVGQPCQHDPLRLRRSGPMQ